MATIRCSLFTRVPVPRLRELPSTRQRPLRRTRSCGPCSRLRAAPTDYLTNSYNAYLAGIPPGTAKDRGVTLGTEIATDFLAARAGDGRGASVPYTFQAPAPGVY